VGLETRKMAARIVLLLGTTVSVLCYNFTRFPFFVALPFLCGVVLVALVRGTPMRTPQELKEGKRARRAGLVQLVISCVILAVLITVSWARHWGTADVGGFIIMEATLLFLALMAFVFYKKGRLRDFSQGEAGRQGSDDGDVEVGPGL
jgi:F0F1-type ATP synthase assembly protein I